MTPQVAAALIAAAATVTSGAMAYVGAHSSARIAKRSAIDLAKFNSQQNEEMYLKYQSPQAQMLQYQAAGLNPNLIYGQSVGGPSAGQADYTDQMAPNKGALLGQAIMQGVQMYQNVMLNDAKVTQANAAAKALETKAALDEAKTTATNIANDFAQAKNAYSLEMLSKDNAMKAIDLEIAQQYKAHEAKAKLDKLLADTDLSRAEKNRVEKQIKLYDQQIAESQARVKHMQQTVALGFGQLDLANRQFKEAQDMNFHKRTMDYNDYTLRKQNFGLAQQKFEFEQKKAVADAMLKYALPSGSFTSSSFWSPMIHGKKIQKSIKGLYGYE